MSFYCYNIYINVNKMKWIQPLFYIALTIIIFSCSKEEPKCSNCANISLSKDMKVSILGDSYSTFQGYLSPNGNPTYYPNSRTEVMDVTQTWWYQFITRNNLILESNNSYSGSTVARKPNVEGKSYIERYLELGNPDFIFVFGGTNDSWQDIPVGDYQYSDWKEDDLLYFRPAFAYLLYELQQTYPKAQIVNLINTDLKKDYKESMETICQYYHICNISLGDFEKIDGHPSKKGMKSICQQITQILIKKYSCLHSNVTY